MRDYRRKEMAAYITRRGSVSMQELCDAFPVSMNTIRADVAFLEQTGTVVKVFRGQETEPCEVYTVVIFGDNDGDGAITAGDARYALRVAVGLETPGVWQKDASLVAENAETV